MKTFFVETDGGTKIEMQAGMALVIEIDGKKYEIEIRELND